MALDIYREPTDIEVVQPGERLTWAATVERWLQTLQAERQPRTVAEYRKYVQLFALFLENRGKSFGDAYPVDVQAFARAPLPSLKTGVMGKPPGASGQTIRLAALRSLYGFVIFWQGQGDGRMPTLHYGANPASPSVTRRTRATAPRPKGLSPEGLNNLLRAVRTAPISPMSRVRDHRPRDYAMLLTMVLTGMRRVELLSLTPSSFDHDGGRHLYRVTVKGGRERYREMPRAAYAAIVDYLQQDGRDLATMGPDEHVFDITPARLYSLVREYGAMIGAPDLTPHGLRHSAAKAQRKAGASIEDVQRFLGHRSAATTARYLATLEDERDLYGAAVAAMITGEATSE